MKRFQVGLGLFTTLIITLSLTQLLLISSSTLLLLPAAAQQPPSVTENAAPGESKMNIIFLPRN
jgi:hypothetical protein